MTTCLQKQVEWIDNCIKYMRSRNLEVIEPTKDAEDQWVAHHDETANATLIANIVVLVLIVASDGRAPGRRDE